jgi:TPR repeat protein
MVEINTDQKYINRFRAAKEVLNDIEQLNAQKAFILATTLSSRFLLSSSLTKISQKKYDKLAGLLAECLETNPLEVMLLYDQENEWWQSPLPPLNVQNISNQEFVSFLNHYVHEQYEALNDLVIKNGIKSEYLPFLAHMSAQGKGVQKSIELATTYAAEFIDACERNELSYSPFIKEKLLGKMNDVLMDIRNESPVAVELFLKSFYKLLIGINDNVRVSQFASIFELCALQETKFSEMIVQSLEKFEAFFSKYVETNCEAATLLGSMQQFKCKINKASGKSGQLYLETALKYYEQALAMAPHVGQHINLFTVACIKKRRAEVKFELAINKFEQRELSQEELLTTFKEVIADDCHNSAPIVYCLNNIVQAKNNVFADAVVPLIEYAANQGNAVFQFQLGCAYAVDQPLIITDSNLAIPSSISLTTNMANARHFLELAAVHNKTAAHMLGQFYLNGNDVIEKNEKKAISFLVEAIKQGSALALTDLALMEIENKKFTELLVFLDKEVTAENLQPFKHILKAVTYQALGSKAAMIQGFLGNLLNISFNKLNDNKSIAEINQLIERFKILSAVNQQKHEFAPCIGIKLNYLRVLQLEPKQKEIECEKINAQLEELQNHKNKMVKLAALLLRAQIKFERGIESKNEQNFAESCAALETLIKEMLSVKNLSKDSFESSIMQEVVNQGFELVQQFEKLPETIINPALKRSCNQKIHDATKSNPFFQIMNVVKGFVPGHLLKLQF